MSLKIEYSNRHGKYITGEIVSGTITIRNDVPIEVTGLKITMFIRCKLVLSKDANGEEKLLDSKEQLYMQHLNDKIFGDVKCKSKVLPAGSLVVPFMFLPLNTDYPPSTEAENTFTRYFVKAELELKSKEAVVVNKGFRVRSRLLDDRPLAQGWQTKTEWKYLKMSLKRISMKATIPNSIGRNETIPIHLAITNESKNPKLIIRLRLIRYRNLPTQSEFSKKQKTISDNVEELSITKSEITLFLKVHCGFSFNCPLISETYRIQIEIETAKSTVLRMEFPVTVGQWRNGPVREIIGTDEVMINEETTESRHQLLNYLLNTIVELNTVSPSAPPISPVTIAPTAPPMDGYGILPDRNDVQTSPHPLSSSNQSLPSVKALYAFTGTDHSELSFNVGQIITNVYQSNEEGWLFGTISGNTGMFPFNFVEPIIII